MLNNIKTVRRDSGFTIVELLIVIVVIGILAAITIVAYNGIQNAAKATSAKQAANSAVKKAEAYNADEDNTTYPLTAAAMTGAAATEVYSLTGVTFSASPANYTAAPATPSTLIFRKCGSGTPATQAAVTASTITGVQIGYWDYANNTTAVLTTGTGTCPTAV